MNIKEKKKIFDHFSQFLTQERKEKFEQVANFRTYYVTVVLEDIYQPHNISAALRSCECFGIQDVHVIEYKHKFKLQESVAKGSGKWLNIIRYNQKGIINTKICYENLKRSGYIIAAMHPNARVNINDVALDKKIALVYGTELEGISEYVEEHSDLFVKIPMFGFTESFNVSVSVALGLQSITNRLRDSKIKWQLTESEILHLKLEWLIRTTQYSKQIKEALGK